MSFSKHKPDNQWRHSFKRSVDSRVPGSGDDSMTTKVSHCKETVVKVGISVTLVGCRDEAMTSMTLAKEMKCDRWHT